MSRAKACFFMRYRDDKTRLPVRRNLNTQKTDDFCFVACDNAI